MSWSSTYEAFAASTLVGTLAFAWLASCSGSSVGTLVQPGDGAAAAATCPASVPDNQSACTGGEAPCMYSGSVVCDCGGGATPVWTCTACPTCPAAQPAAGAACMAATPVCGAALSCPYATTNTSCTCGAGAGGPGDTWHCGTCPATPPAAIGTACTTEGLECDYGTTTCTCRGADWACVTPPPACPSVEPAAGGTCTAGTGGLAGCVYTTGTCRCRRAAGAAMGETWECAAPPPACPATEPAAASSCTAGTGGGAGCTYGAATCRCGVPAGAGGGPDAGDVWTCG